MSLSERLFSSPRRGAVKSGAATFSILPYRNLAWIERIT
jgi:hypothetical protein